jgi:class 3 adenylate cyclase/pimeloyl-ACP methyl ester carboxylesterase
VRETSAVEISDVTYARSGEVAIAYQVIGDGPLDVVLVPDWVSNLVWAWHTPYWRNFYERLGSFARLIVFDKRGTGLSDRPRFFPDLETRIDDLRAVLDAVGSERAALVAAQEGCWMATLFAATFPERTHSLALYHPWLGRSDPRLARPDEEDLLGLRDAWGTNELADGMLGEWTPSPTLFKDMDYRVWYRDWLRLSASPAGAYAFWKMAQEVDFHDIYPTVRVPTLVLYREYRHDAHEMYADVARLIPDSRLVALPGNDYMGIFLDDPAQEIEAFLRDGPTSGEPERVLTTVLFTDVVGSTEQLSHLGDASWRDLVERHHDLVRRLLTRYRGTEIDTAGDGFFATFDGPARAIRCARAIQAQIVELGIGARAGVHTGECEIIDGKPGGLAVVVGARISAAAEAGEVLVSGTVRDLVAGSGMAFEDRGEHELKGVPGAWRLYAAGLD